MNDCLCLCSRRLKYVSKIWTLESNLENIPFRKWCSFINLSSHINALYINVFWYKHDYMNAFFEGFHYQGRTNIYKIRFFEDYYLISCHWSLAIPAESIIKVLVFLYFQGASQEISGMKWLTPKYLLPASPGLFPII